MINIVINLQFQACHNWPDCPIEEVSFLKYPHRHIFHICCKKNVIKADREIEIIMMKNEVLNYLNRNFYDDKLGFGNFNARSCETIALDLVETFDLNYCSVLEDNENGAEVCK